MKRLNYSAGLKNGPAVEYYSDGIRKWEGNYVDDQLSGFVISYFENGSKKEEANFSLGRKHELVKTYFPNGHVKTEEIWVNNNKAQIKWFNMDGTIRYVQEFDIPVVEEED